MKANGPRFVFSQILDEPFVPLTLELGLSITTDYKDERINLLNAVGRSGWPELLWTMTGLSVSALLILAERHLERKQRFLAKRLVARSDLPHFDGKRHPAEVA